MEIITYYILYMSPEAEHTLANNVIKLRDHFEGADEMAIEVVEESSKFRTGIMGRIDEIFMSPEELYNKLSSMRYELANVNIPPLVENKNVIPLHSTVGKIERLNG